MSYKTVTFCGADLKAMYMKSGCHFICDAISNHYKCNGESVAISSEELIVQLKGAVPNRFKKEDPRVHRSTVGGWMLSKYFNRRNVRKLLIDRIPDDFQFTLNLYVRQ